MPIVFRMMILVSVTRCNEPGCIRLAWRGGLCWWCARHAEAGKPPSQVLLDLPRHPEDSLDPMTPEDRS